MGTLYNGTDKDYDFRKGTTTKGWDDNAPTRTLDPGGNQPPPATVPGPDIDTSITPPPATGGGGSTTPPPTTVPDFVPKDVSGDVDQSYNIPPIKEVPFSTDSGTADPTMTPWDVTREQTVQGQLEDLYNRDSPFFEQARQRAIRQHLAGGGQNSAMAAGFGELAAMDTAFKVGFADAQTYARSAEFNAAMKNQFSLAEQRFIHNALLSDQAFRQAGELQTQRLVGQMEAINLDYKNQFGILAQQHQYALDGLYKQAALAEGQAGRDFARTMTLNGMTAMTNFMMNGINSVIQSANQPGMTAAQSAAAMQQGMAWMRQQFDFMQSYWGAYAAGGPVAEPNWMGQSSTSVGDAWWQYPASNSSTVTPGYQGPKYATG